jgi:hypothetical protein
MAFARKKPPKKYDMPWVHTIIELPFVLVAFSISSTFLGGQAGCGERREYGRKRTSAAKAAKTEKRFRHG